MFAQGLLGHVSRGSVAQSPCRRRRLSTAPKSTSPPNSTEPSGSVIVTQWIKFDPSRAGLPTILT